ncbi:MAG: YjgN family protein [Symbiopectobacterium sp.]|uniref:YjgN family protein n=1 Tax=Symbiopectobacterium sp. TaxID=2952789 RepID=UPI0039E845E8
MSDNISQGNGKHAVVFHGKSGEYFLIWLVNALLTVITLGIYSAWATVRTRRYFYGNTEINGDRFDYHAEPIQILKGRIIVIGALALFYLLLMVAPLVGMAVLLAFAALLPLLIIRNWRYNAIMTSYRGVRFNYLGTVKSAYWAFLAVPLLMVAVLVLFMTSVGNISSIARNFTPVVVTSLLYVPALVALGGVMKYMIADFYVNNLRFGNTAFNAAISKSGFIKIAFVSLLVFFPFLVWALGYAGSAIASLVQQIQPSGDAFERAQYRSPYDSIFQLVVAYISLIIGGLVAKCYIVVAERNYIFSNTALGDNVQIHSTVTLRSYLMLLFTNTLITLFSLGLATPVAHVRYARFMANVTQVSGDLSLLNVQAYDDAARSAVAEEAISALDINVGI